MKKFLSSLFVVFLGVFLLGSFSVKAEEALVETVHGAAIRTEGVQGLRFSARLVEGINPEDVGEHGFYLVYGNWTVAELQARDAFTNLEVEGKEIFKVPVTGFTLEGSYNVVLIGIPKKGYMDTLTVIPYAFAADGEEEVLAAPVTRSVGQIALAMGDDAPEGIIDAINNNYVRVGFVGEQLQVAKGVEGVDINNYEFYHNPETITFPNAPTKEYHTFSHYKLGEQTYAAGEQVTVSEALYGTYELVYTYDLENIQTIRTKVKGDGVEFTGVVTGVQYRDGVAKGTVRTLVVSDNTAAIHIYNPTVSSDVAIGDLVHISGSIDVYINLFQVGSGGTVTILSNDNDLPNETVLSSIADLDESKQGYRINVENLEVVSISGDNVTVSDGINSVNVYFDPVHDVPELNPGLSVGDRVNLNNIHVGWHSNLQLAPYHVDDISIRVLTNQEKVAYAVGNYVLLHNNKQFNMGTELNLPTADLLHGAAIVWSENSNIVDGKFIDVTEDKEFTLTGIMTVEDATQEIELTLTIKYVDPSGPVEEVIYETGFELSEGFTAGTTYNNTTIAYTGSTGKQWGTYYGTPSETGALSGSQSIQMRWYSSATSNLGYTQTNFKLEKVTKVIFLAENTNKLNVKVLYSLDKTDWVGEEQFTLTTNATAYTYNLPSEYNGEEIYIRFQIVLPSTNPTATSRLYIDDVKIYGYVDQTTDPDPTKYKVTYDADGGTPIPPIEEVEEGTKATKPANNPTKAGYTFEGWYIEDVEFDFNTLITADITLKARWEEDGGTGPSELTVTASYSGSTTGNMSSGTNNATIIGLDDTIFEVLSSTSGQNQVGFNKDGTIRLYGSSNYSVLTIKIDNNYEITDIKFVFGGTVNSYKIKDGDTNLYAGNDKGDKEYNNLTSNQISIENTGSGQTHIKSIVITYRPK